MWAGGVHRLSSSFILSQATRAFWLRRLKSLPPVEDQPVREVLDRIDAEGQGVTVHAHRHHRR